jgi:hypothetical protein
LLFAYIVLTICCQALEDKSLVVYQRANHSLELNVPESPDDLPSPEETAALVTASAKKVRLNEKRDYCFPLKPLVLSERA